MAKTKNSTRKQLYLVLVISLVISFAYSGFKYLYPPQPTQIMAITPIPLEYGHTTIEGTLRKDSPKGKDGSFFIVLPNMEVVFLDVDGIDNLLGQEVRVTGNLLEPITETDKLIIIPDQITLK